MLRSLLEIKSTKTQILSKYIVGRLTGLKIDCNQFVFCNFSKHQRRTLIGRILVKKARVPIRDGAYTTPLTLPFRILRFRVIAIVLEVVGNFPGDK